MNERIVNLPPVETQENVFASAGDNVAPCSATSELETQDLPPPVAPPRPPVQPEENGGAIPLLGLTEKDQVANQPKPAQGKQDRARQVQEQKRAEADVKQAEQRETEGHQQDVEVQAEQERTDEREASAKAEKEHKQL